MSNNAILNDPTVKLYSARANEAEMAGAYETAKFWRNMLSIYLKGGK